MFSLIITVISIALVAALALATLFYGGGAFNKGSAQAEASTILNQGQQLVGAAQLYRAEKNAWPADLNTLVSEGYLKSIPAADAGTPGGVLSSAVAATNPWTMPAANPPVFVLRNATDPDSCSFVNLQGSLGEKGILRRAYSSLATQCFGSAPESLTVVFHLGASLEDLQGVLEPGQEAGQAPASPPADVDWYLKPGTSVAVPPAEEEPTPDPEPTPTVTLQEQVLPDAMLNQAYEGFSFENLLLVNGEVPTALDEVLWGMEGTLPAGMSFAEGVLSGTPTEKTTGTDFTVMATYQEGQGQTVYTIRVGDAVLRATSVSAGANHSCAVTTAGGVKCWGINNYGQLGNGTKTDSSTPVDVVGLTGVVSVSAGNTSTCVITQSSSLLCWGGNSFGQLGTGNTGESLTPVAVTGLPEGATSVVVGGSRACALTTAGAAKCWGAGARGALGTGSLTDRYAPTQVTGLTSGVVKIAGGSSHFCALSSTGEVRCWGANSSGEVSGASGDQRNPVLVADAAGASDISLGITHSCVVVGGAVKCWGANDAKQLGVEGANRSTPAVVPGAASGVLTISAGGYHTCAQMTDSSLRCWGYNSAGQLGNGSIGGTSTAATTVGGLSAPVVQVEGGDTHTCALLANGNTACWGMDTYGQLGDDAARANKGSPVTVQP